MPKARPFKDFIELAKAVHGNKYYYVDDSYKSQRSHLTIICPSHGEFSQKGTNHLAGHGCPECGQKNKMQRISSWKLFLSKISSQNAKYSCSEAPSGVWNYHSPLTFLCTDHGEFSAKPHELTLKKIACSSCAFEYRKTKELPEELRLKIIELAKTKAVEVLLDTYAGWNHPIEIVCKDHGKKFPLFSNLIKGTGCRECSSEVRRLNDVEVKRRLRSLYGDSLTIEQLSLKPLSSDLVTVFCAAHGRNTKKIGTILSGRGCSECSRSLSTPERVIGEILTTNGLDFERQWSKGPRGKSGRALPYDFFIPVLNTLLEHDGPHHRKPLYGRNEEQKIANFNEQKIRDNVKTQWALDNNYSIVRTTENSRKRLLNQLSDLLAMSLY